MREFFKGWRRKVGCVTLLMALLLAVGWVRSYQDQEIVIEYRGQSANYFIHSREGILCGVGDQISYGQFQLWSASYWSIILALTLLSA